MTKTLERPTEPGTAPMSTTKDTATVKVRPLTGHDRCDAGAVNKHKAHAGTGKGSCDAQAYVLAVLPSGSEILFCGHHAGMQAPGSKEAKNIEILKGMGALIWSEQYAALSAKPTL